MRDNLRATQDANVVDGSLRLTLNAASIPGLAGLKDLALLMKPHW